MDGPKTVPVTFTLYPAPHLTFLGTLGGIPPNIQVDGRLQNDGVPYNNIMITKAYWPYDPVVPLDPIIDATTGLPFVIPSLAGGGVSNLFTIRATLPPTYAQAGFADCVSGTAVSPLSGKTVTWADYYPGCVQ